MIAINDFITIVSGITSVGVLIGMLFTLFRWLNKQKKQDTDIRGIKKEMTLICFCMQACLDGLEQLGANHTVPVAKEKLEKHLNKMAHEQEEE